MDNLFIKETETTPEINFHYQQGLLEIKGVSIPEDTEEFYSQLLEYIDQYTQAPSPSNRTMVHFKLIYTNTSTSAIISRIIRNFNVLKDTPEHDVEIRWYYEDGDDDMRDIGNDFQGFSAVPFKLIACEEIF
jgi:glucuronate isomerase